MGKVSALDKSILSRVDYHGVETAPDHIVFIFHFNLKYTFHLLKFCAEYFQNSSCFNHGTSELFMKSSPTNVFLLDLGL